MEISKHRASIFYVIHIVIQVQTVFNQAIKFFLKMQLLMLMTSKVIVTIVLLNRCFYFILFCFCFCFLSLHPPFQLGHRGSNTPLSCSSVTPNQDDIWNLNSCKFMERCFEMQRYYYVLLLEYLPVTIEASTYFQTKKHYLNQEILFH